MKKIDICKEQEEIILDAETVNEFSNDYLKAILDLEKGCFPPDWQYKDAEEYYKEILKDNGNINIFLKCNNKIGGYLLATPFKKAFGSLKKYDSELKLNPGSEKMIYLETIQILPEFRGMNGAEKLIIKMCEEGKNRGMKKFSIHARKKNKLDKKVKKMFSGKIITSRNIKKWHYGGNEPYRYIECLI